MFASSKYCYKMVITVFQLVGLRTSTVKMCNCFSDFTISVLILINCLRKGHTWDSLLYNYVGRKDGHFLFNDAFNTFYLRLYGVRHMVKDNSIVRKEVSKCFI